MKIRTLIYIVILLLIVNVAALVTIVVNRVSPDRQFRPRVTEPGEPPQFKFSAKERQQMELSRKVIDSTVAPIMGQIQETRHRLFDELNAEQPDTLKVYVLIDEIATLQSAIHKRLVDRFIIDREYLSPEQRAKMLRFIEERSQGEQRGRWGFGMRRGGPGPGPDGDR